MYCYQRLIVVWLSYVLLASSASAQQDGLAVRWRPNLDAAKIEAAQSGKLVLLHFWTPTCGPCRVLDEKVFVHPQFVSGLEQHFVPVKVNAEASPALRTAFRIRSVPTDVILTPQGNLVTSLGCPNEPGQYLAQLTNLAQHYQRTTAAAAQRGNLPPQMNAAYAGLDAGRYQTTPPMQQAAMSAAAPPATIINAATPQQALTPSEPGPMAPTAATTALTTTVASQPQVQTNPYLTAGVGTAQTAPATAAPQDAPAAATAAPRSEMPLDAQSVVAAGAAPAIAGAATSAPQPGQLASDVAAQQQLAATAAPVTPWPPQLPANVAPLAFDGYCPVSLKTDNRWVRGDVRYGRQHRGRTYLFASPERMEAFMTDPDDYSPVFNGMDPVVLLDENRAIEGSRRFGFKHRGLFYLFSSAETMKRFEGDPDTYAAGVRQAMGRLDSGDGVIRR